MHTHGWLTHSTDTNRQREGDESGRLRGMPKSSDMAGRPKAKDKDKDKSKSKTKDKDKAKSKAKDKDRSKAKDKDKEKSKAKDKEKSKAKDKEKSKAKDKEKAKDKATSSKRERGKAKDKSKSKEKRRKDEELPPASTLYDTALIKEFVSTPVEELPASELSGFLSRYGAERRVWKSKWVHIRLPNATLYTFRSRQPEQETGINYHEAQDKIRLATASVHELAESEGGRKWAFILRTPKRDLWLAARNSKESAKWMDLITRVGSAAAGRRSGSSAPSPSIRSNHLMAGSAQSGSNLRNLAARNNTEAQVEVAEPSSPDTVPADMDDLMHISRTEKISEITLTTSAGKVVRDKSERTKIEDFKQVSVIGQGAFAKVLLVKRRGTSKYYAMKIISRRKLRKKIQIEHTKAEKESLVIMDHPFVIKLHYAFHTADKLMLVLDYCNGGELFYTLETYGPFTEVQTRLYTAELSLALGYLHSQSIIFRDLKPENILLDSGGHIVLTDFGLVKKLENPDAKTSTFCGTAEYTAPEMIEGKPYGRQIDWWALGILVFEMMAGDSPFPRNKDNASRQDVYDAILNEPLIFDDMHDISQAGRDFISRLLDRNATSRLGSGSSDVEELKTHAFFTSLNWDDVFAKRTEPVYIPSVRAANDLSNIDDDFLRISIHESNVSVRSEDSDGLFDNFSFYGSVIAAPTKTGATSTSSAEYRQYADDLIFSDAPTASGGNVIQ
ncbi:AGC/SGK protein kinase [Thecamonas trahens ATCC 50062]|uniref:AGC/SGK protein kinase n=1 Tax=Thecamonas trahens ATCC 50062 TaxID=461836 RepID=A0A0L0DJR4_THETB|nr:AGC/SGK protein kinase [Thecamonas trahens ATCC 50062]KNC52440.1 AGC/SGK protein kinase [Thecamonas trahens ATCC 50062]|eukprot:XP_013755481.1 AGC/SGK protein kinase [Thecamonas trahens ATCC 50062]